MIWRGNAPIYIKAECVPVPTNCERRGSIINSRRKRTILFVKPKKNNHYFPQVRIVFCNGLSCMNMSECFQSALQDIVHGYPRVHWVHMPLRILLHRGCLQICMAYVNNKCSYTV